MRQLLPKVLLEHSYPMSLCDLPTPHSLAQSYQSLLFLGSVLCCLLLVVGKMHAVSKLLHFFYSKRVTYIQITEVFIALSLRCFCCAVFWKFLRGGKKMLPYKMICLQSLWNTVLLFGACQHPSEQKPPQHLAVGMVKASYCDFLLPLHSGCPRLLPFFSWWVTSSMRWSAIAIRNWTVVQLHSW